MSVNNPICYSLRKTKYVEYLILLFRKIKNLRKSFVAANELLHIHIEISLQNASNSTGYPQKHL
jgi:hypothetical protein